MAQTPQIFYQGNYTIKDLDLFKSQGRIWEVVDIYDSQLNELFEILNPGSRLLANYSEKLAKFKEERSSHDPASGDWIYFPWNGILVHTLSEDNYFSLRTNRNKNIITEEEQVKLRESSIGIVGLSIGSHFATGLSYSGFSKHLKLAEVDTLDTTNLNRVRAGLKDIGSSKIDITTQQIYDIDPYANLEIFDHGLTEENLSSFLAGDKKLNLVFEAIDDFEMKIKLRLKARELGIPVIMLTNLGDRLLIDVERYDQNQNLPLFNGLIGNTPEEILHSEVSEKEKVKFAIKIVGVGNIPTRVLKTLLEINKSAVGRPQIYSTVTIAEGVAAYLARRVILGKSLSSGRILIQLKEAFGLNSDTDENDGRAEVMAKLQGSFEI